MSILRSVIVFLFLLLSLDGGGHAPRSAAAPSPSGGTDSLLMEQKGPQDEGCDVFSHDMCLSAAQGWTFSGNGNGNSAPVRILPGERRIPSAHRSGRWTLSCGKTLDIHSFNTLFPSSGSKRTGPFNFDRFIFSICCLRL
ncbi:MAG: hypothetical protein IJ202_08040 [Bacteroidales bacterium]|nr:hypothetical protein [Bacteroidales bacterium]